MKKNYIWLFPVLLTLFLLVGCNKKTTATAITTRPVEPTLEGDAGIVQVHLYYRDSDKDERSIDNYKPIVFLHKEVANRDIYVYFDEKGDGWFSITTEVVDGIIFNYSTTNTIKVDVDGGAFVTLQYALDHKLIEHSDLIDISRSWNAYHPDELKQHLAHYYRIHITDLDRRYTVNEYNPKIYYHSFTSEVTYVYYCKLPFCIYLINITIETIDGFEFRYPDSCKLMVDLGGNEEIPLADAFERGLLTHEEMASIYTTYSGRRSN